MAQFTRSSVFATFLLLLVLLKIVEMGPTIVGGRKCDSPSKKFNGMCMNHDNCATVCQTESHGDGKCEGFYRRCICIKPCF
ncbi:hypothetical protein ES288_A03G145600v1 [Gossypium darwinii]|uniref:Knottins-like domain-containing protein n=1 Tax=Gossypium darwinii TaxID=34276 RepID=A0A5D2H4K9_GOSDA|nr:hypothetical protein ES288_A03G145600v1 [Gossypium darwinii]